MSFNYYSAIEMLFRERDEELREKITGMYRQEEYFYLIKKEFIAKEKEIEELKAKVTELENKLSELNK